MMSSARSSQKKRLGRRLVLTAQAACDAQDLETALQVVQAAEILLQDGKMTAQDRYGVAELIVGIHVQLWGLRHRERAGAALMATTRNPSCAAEPWIRPGSPPAGRS